jgi:hypothetical protein
VDLRGKQPPIGGGKIWARPQKMCLLFLIKLGIGELETLPSLTSWGLGSFCEGLGNIFPGDLEQENKNPCGLLPAAFSSLDLNLASCLMPDCYFQCVCLCVCVCVCVCKREREKRQTDRHRKRQIERRVSCQSRAEIQACGITKSSMSSPGLQASTHSLPSPWHYYLPSCHSRRWTRLILRMKRRNREVYTCKK